MFIPVAQPPKYPSMNTSPSTLAQSTASSLKITDSRQLTAWLAEQNLSLVFTTYQASRAFWIGLQPTGKLEIFQRTFPRCMGLYAESSTLYLSSLYQLWRLENILEPGQTHNGYDRLYVPQVAYTTGDLDIHDVAIDSLSRVIFVNTLFSCVATLSDTHSFRPLWQPPFISRLAAEDRCHLNGLAMRDGQPRYVTAISRSDVADGWREHRQQGGCLIDIATGDILLSQLSMPHSPRWYRDRLWLLNSGTGEFGYVDLEAGRFEPVVFCPGYLRGCAFSGDFAILGISKPRHNSTFSGLPLEETLRQKHAESRCGLLVIDLRSGDIVHWLQIEGAIEELYDIAVLPGVRRPMALGLQTDEIRRAISIGPAMDVFTQE
ncbi:MAG: TIGR03032 family protein [Geitlerinemataceae cyanobacterium]